MLLELCVRYPLRGLPENFFCKRSGNQLEEYTDPNLVWQLDPLSVPVPAFEFFPTLDDIADAAYSFGSKRSGLVSSWSSISSVPSPMGSYSQLRRRHCSKTWIWSAWADLMIVWALPSVLSLR